MILQSCERCGRQYDVSHLAVGSPVRCLCDARWSVKRPKRLTVRAKRCSGCGGRLEPGDVACSFCGAELEAPAEESLLCPGCFTRLEAAAKHCSKCGVAIAPQALTALREGQACPRCAGALGVRALGTQSVVECTACAGMWVSADTFRALCRRARESAADPSEGAGARGEGRALEPVSYIPCLICGERMWRRQFRYRDASSRVIVDFCREHGIWLDADELERITSFLRERAGRGLVSDPDRALGRSDPPFDASASAGGVLGSRPRPAAGRPASGSEASSPAELLGEATLEVLGWLSQLFTGLRP